MAEAPVGQAKKLPEQDLADKLAVVTYDEFPSDCSHEVLLPPSHSPPL